MATQKEIHEATATLYELFNAFLADEKTDFNELITTLHMIYDQHDPSLSQVLTQYHQNRAVFLPILQFPNFHKITHLLIALIHENEQILTMPLYNQDTSAAQHAAKDEREKNGADEETLINLIIKNSSKIEYQAIITWLCEHKPAILTTGMDLAAQKITTSPTPQQLQRDRFQQNQTESEQKIIEFMRDSIKRCLTPYNEDAFCDLLDTCPREDLLAALIWNNNETLEFILSQYRNQATAKDFNALEHLVTESYDFVMIPYPANNSVGKTLFDFLCDRDNSRFYAHCLRLIERDHHYRLNMNQLCDITAATTSSKYENNSVRSSRTQGTRAHPGPDQLHHHQQQEQRLVASLVQLNPQRNLAHKSNPLVDELYQHFCDFIQFDSENDVIDAILAPTTELANLLTQYYYQPRYNQWQVVFHRLLEADCPERLCEHLIQLIQTNEAILSLALHHQPIQNNDDDDEEQSETLLDFFLANDDVPRFKAVITWLYDNKPELMAAAKTTATTQDQHQQRESALMPLYTLSHGPERPASPRFFTASDRTAKYSKAPTSFATAYQALSAKDHWRNATSAAEAQQYHKPLVFNYGRELDQEITDDTANADTNLEDFFKPPQSMVSRAHDHHRLAAGRIPSLHTLSKIPDHTTLLNAPDADLSLATITIEPKRDEATTEKNKKIKKIVGVVDFETIVKMDRIEKVGTFDKTTAARTATTTEHEEISKPLTAKKKKKTPRRPSSPSSELCLKNSSNPRSNDGISTNPLAAETRRSSAQRRGYYRDYRVTPAISSPLRQFCFTASQTNIDRAQEEASELAIMGEKP